MAAGWLADGWLVGRGVEITGMELLIPALGLVWKPSSKHIESTSHVTTPAHLYGDVHDPMLCDPFNRSAETCRKVCSGLLHTKSPKI